MYKQLMIIAAGLTLWTTALLAQITAGTVGGQNFQQAGTMVRTVEGQPIVLPFSARTIAGSPFSGTEERRTTQTLGDGTVLDTPESNALYRDSEGRTRTERSVQGKTIITIVDPVAHTSVRLDPSTKTAWKTPSWVGFGLATSVPTAAEAEAADKLMFEAGLSAGMTTGGGRGAAVARTPVSTTPPDAGVKAALDSVQKKLVEMQALQNAASRATEDLGMLQQNGVSAQGTRTTITIPVGQIGNNREIKVVNERWYSQDLQMIVKSINSDPRFGTTTYDLKNISRSNPDASLFQIPGDYTTIEGGGRRGGK
jgi:hypothetical protein